MITADKLRGVTKESYNVNIEDKIKCIDEKLLNVAKQGKREYTLGLSYEDSDNQVDAIMKYYKKNGFKVNLKFHADKFGKVYSRDLIFKWRKKGFLTRLFNRNK